MKEFFYDRDVNTIDDLDQLRHMGFSDEEILDVVLITAYYNFMTRIADALGVELDEYIRARAARRTSHDATLPMTIKTSPCTQVNHKAISKETARFFDEARPSPPRKSAVPRCGGGQGHGAHPPAPQPWGLPLSEDSNVGHIIGRRAWCPLSLLHRHLPRYPFSSFFSSLRKRQSVPWAMSFCGLDLSIPASWRRRA
jgi:hypothetical protein